VISKNSFQYKNAVRFKPQPGPQTDFLSASADVVFYGGAAGGGKSYGLLLEPLRHINNSYFGGVIFRRELTQIIKQGALWDESVKMYGVLGAKPRQSPGLDWTFPSGMKMSFGYLTLDKHVHDWQGAQIPYIGFDELIHFTEYQFFYMLSRNRSTSGPAGYIRATMNPDPDSWVRRFIDWYIGPDGYVIPSRAGKIRWFIRVDDTIIWADKKEKIDSKEHPAKSFTFIPAKLTDNKILLAKDPGYLGSLKALTRVERERLLEGNWNIRATAGTLFRRSDIEVVDAAPSVGRVIRYWDRAGTKPNPQNPDPDWTRGLKMKKSENGIHFIEDLSSLRDTPGKVEIAIKNVATQDGRKCSIGIEQDPGQAGKAEAGYYVRQLSGFIVKCYPVSKDKVTRALPVVAQCEAGNVKVVRGPWNNDLFDELEAFPDGGHDDIVDTTSGAFNALNGTVQNKPRISRL